MPSSQLNFNRRFLWMVKKQGIMGLVVLFLLPVFQNQIYLFVLHRCVWLLERLIYWLSLCKQKKKENLLQMINYQQRKIITEHEFRSDSPEKHLGAGHSCMANIDALTVQQHNSIIKGGQTASGIRRLCHPQLCSLFFAFFVCFQLAVQRVQQTGGQ